MIYFCLGMPHFLSAQNEEDADVLRRETELTINDNEKAKQLCELCSLETEKGKYGEALTKARQGLGIAYEQESRHTIAYCLRIIGNVYYQKGGNDYDDALARYRQSLAFYRFIRDPEGKAACFRGMGNVYLAKEQYRRAVCKMRKSIKHERKMGNKGNIADRLVDIATVYQKMKRYPQALDWYNKALKEYKGLNNIEGQIFCHAQRGELYYRQRNFDKAVNELKPNIELAQGNLNQKADFKYRIGEIMFEARRFKPAIDDYLVKAKTDYTSVGNQEGIRRCQNMMVKGYEALGQLTQAEGIRNEIIEGFSNKDEDNLNGAKYREKQADDQIVQQKYIEADGNYNHAYDIYIKEGNDLDQGRINYKWANLYYIRGNYAIARDKYQKALASYEKMPDEFKYKEGQAQCHLRLAKIYINSTSLFDLPKAEDHLKKCEQLCNDNSEMNNIEADRLQLYGDWHKKKGNTPKAEEYYGKSKRKRVDN